MNDLKGIIEDCNKSDLISDKIIKKIISIIGQEEWQDLHDENNDICTTMGELIITLKGIAELERENEELKELIEKYRQAVDKCLHITFMGGGCEVNTIGQYATLVDGYLTDVEGLAKWKD